MSAVCVFVTYQDGAAAADQDELVPGPDGKLISTEERLQQLQLKQTQDDSAIQGTHARTSRTHLLQPLLLCSTRPWCCQLRVYFQYYVQTVCMILIFSKSNMYNVHVSNSGYKS